MKKNFRRITAVILALSLVFTCLMPVFAQDEEEIGDISKGKTLVNIFGKVADVVLTGVSRLFPEPEIPGEDGYVSSNFFSGTTEFRKDAADGDAWFAGYGSRSLIPADLKEKGYVVAGEFHIVNETCKEILDGDDMRVNAVALRAGEQGETVLFIAIDGFGMTGTNIRRIREKLSDECERYNVVSVNVSLSHAHSCIDVHGLGAGILELLGKNILETLTMPLRLIGKGYRKGEATDDEYMSFVFSQAEAAATQALSSMKKGTMGFSCYDIEDMLHDKQLPYVFDTNVNVITFTPGEEGAREIWLVNMGCHPVRMDGKDVVSSDYPGEIVRYASAEANADVAFYQGSQLAITRNEAPLKLGEDEVHNSKETEAEKCFYSACKFGRMVVDRILNDEAVESFPIEPILNIAHKEIKVPTDNALLLLIAKIGMINNTVLRTSRHFEDSVILSEVGYCELGKRLCIGLIPGELDPAIPFGGVYGADRSWSGKDWGYPSFRSVVGSGRKLIMFGLTNDQIGYIVPDNDYAHPFASLFEDQIGGSANKHYEEMISVGSHVASTVSEAFIATVNESKTK